MNPAHRQSLYSVDATGGRAGDFGIAAVFRAERKGCSGDRGRACDVRDHPAL